MQTQILDATAFAADKSEASALDFAFWVVVAVVEVLRVVGVVPDALEVALGVPKVLGIVLGVLETLAAPPGVILELVLLVATRFSL